MGIRDQNLDTIAPVLATFKISQTGGIDDLKDADIGKAVTLTGAFTVGLCSSGSIALGKLIALSLSDADDGERVATVQIGGVCRLPISTTYPVVGNRVVGGEGGTVRQAPALTGYDPAGGAIARGTVLAVNGSIDCVILLN
jgi:predicted RecA/RadA family phage recombinase